MWIVSILFFLLGCCYCAPNVLLNCNVRIKYLHVQEMSDRYMQISSNITSILGPALQSISTSYPGSSFGIWRMQDKQDPAPYCAQPDLKMTQDMNQVNTVISGWSTTQPQYNGGSVASELLMYLPYSAAVGWEFGDDASNDPNTRVVKIIGIATSDGTFNYYDSQMSNLMPSYAQYDRSYDPTDLAKCHNSEYPQYEMITKALVDYDVYPLILTAGNTVSSEINASAPMVSQWWSDLFTQVLNVSDRATVATITSSDELVNAIMTAASRADCSTTTTTANVNCEVRLKYVQMLQRKDASIAPNMYPIQDAILSYFPTSILGYGSTLPRSAGNMYGGSMQLTDNYFVNGVNETFTKHDVSNHTGSGYMDAMWSVPTQQHWSTDQGQYWMIPGIRVISLVVSDGDWFAEDGNPANDGNGYDLPTDVYGPGYDYYSPRQPEMRTNVSMVDLASTRFSLLNNDIHVQVLTAPGNVSPAFGQGTVTDWWINFFTNTLQIPNNFQICDAGENYQNAAQCVIQMSQELQAKRCNHIISTTTSTPTPPTFTTVMPTFSCAQRYQVILLTTESAEFQPKFLDTKNDVRYFAENLLTKFPGSSLGVVASQNKDNLCVTSVVRQSDDLTELKASIDSWMNTSSPDVQGTNMAEIIWYLKVSGAWDVELGTAYASVPKINVLALLTDDGTFFFQDGFSTKFDQYGYPYDAYPANDTQNPTAASGYTPSDPTMCHASSYPTKTMVQEAILANDLYTVLLYPDTNKFHSHIWDQSGQSYMVTTDWWENTYADMGLPSSRLLHYPAGFNALTDEVGENLLAGLSSISAFTCSSTSSTTTTFAPNSEVRYLHIMRRDTAAETLADYLPGVAQSVMTSYPGSRAGIWSGTMKATGLTSDENLAFTSDIGQFENAITTMVANASNWSANYPGNAVLELLYVVAQSGGSSKWSSGPRIISFLASDGDSYYRDGISTNDFPTGPLPYVAYATYDPTDIAEKQSVTYPGLQSLNEAIVDNDIFLVIYAYQTKPVSSGWSATSWNCIDWWNDFLQNKLKLSPDHYSIRASDQLENMAQATIDMIGEYFPTTTTTPPTV